MSENDVRQHDLPGATRSLDAILQMIADQLPAIIYTLDRDLRFTLSIGGALRHIGMRCKEVVGVPLDEFLAAQPGPESGVVLRTYGRALAGETVDYEHTWNGRRFRVRLRPMYEDAEIVGVIGVAHDVTKQNAADELLRDEARQQLRLIRAAIEQVHDMVVITEAPIDLPGPRIVYCNSAFEHVTGYTAEEVIGQTPRILQGPQTSKRVIRAVRAALEAGESFEGETINYRKDGRPYNVEWRISPVRDGSGTIVNWVSIQRDVTEERRREERARQRESELAHAARLSAIGEMASGLAHELNQPLAAIANFASGALERHRHQRLPAEDLEAVLQRITQQAERSGEIIRRMRRFVRKREPQREPTRIADLVDAAAGLMQSEFRRQGVTLQMDLEDDLPVLKLDSIQIEQVLLNLMRNAAEAMESAPAEDRVLTVRGWSDDRWVRLEVADRGPDVPEERLQSMFNPFFTTKSTGMGVGLNISETLVEAHGGRLAARRAEPHGLCVTVELPNSRRRRE